MRRVALIAVLMAIAVSATAETISLDEYIASLERISALLAANQLPAAKAEATRLTPLDIAGPSGRFHADGTLLLAIANARDNELPLRTRVDVTIEELRVASSAPARRADRKLLEKVAAAQEVPELVPGGELATKPAPTPLIVQVFQSIQRAYDWVADKIQRFLEWLLDLFPSIEPGDPGATDGMRWIVGGLVTVIVLLVVLLAIEVTRRSRRRKPELVESTEPIGSTRDEDPLSREGSEWERYAAQLAASGRYREGIRAWYHAVLVTCYADGILYFRKSRTNWEYISALSPALAWRADFIQLTRAFEREWYGAENSGVDAFEDCEARARSIIGAVRENARGAA